MLDLRMCHTSWFYTCAPIISRQLLGPFCESSMLVFLRTMVRTRRRALRLPVGDASNISFQKAWFERHSYRITTRGFIHWRRLPVHLLIRASLFFNISLHMKCMWLHYRWFIICRRAVRIPATVRICSAVYHWFFSCSMISAFNAISTQIIWVCRFRSMEINAAQHVGKGSQWNVVLHFRERSPACRQGLASFSKNF